MNEKNDNKYEKLHFRINRILLIILGLLLFFIGRYSLFLKNEIKIPYKVVQDENQKQAILDLLVMIENFEEIEIHNDLEIIGKIGERSDISKDLSGFLYVASKRGKKYYELNSKEAKKLSEKNKIYFKTKEEVEEAGYIK